MKTYSFKYQNYDCFVFDSRGFKNFAQLDVVDPNFPERRRSVSIPFGPEDTPPEDANLVNYMLDQEVVKEMLNRLMETGFPETYGEEET